MDYVVEFDASHSVCIVVQQQQQHTSIYNIRAAEFIPTLTRRFSSFSFVEERWFFKRKRKWQNELKKKQKRIKQSQNVAREMKGMKKMPPLPKRPRHPQRWRDDELSESSRLEEETRNTYRYLISHFIFISSIRALLRVILFNSSRFFRAFLPILQIRHRKIPKYRPESIPF